MNLVSLLIMALSVFMVALCSRTIISHWRYSYLLVIVGPLVNEVFDQNSAVQAALFVVMLGCFAFPMHRFVQRWRVKPNSKLVQVCQNKSVEACGKPTQHLVATFEHNVEAVLFIKSNVDEQLTAMAESIEKITHLLLDFKQHGVHYYLRPSAVKPTDFDYWDYVRQRAKEIIFEQLASNDLLSEYLFLNTEAEKLAAMFKALGWHSECVNAGQLGAFTWHSMHSLTRHEQLIFGKRPAKYT